MSSLFESGCKLRLHTTASCLFALISGSLRIFAASHLFSSLSSVTALLNRHCSSRTPLSLSLHIRPSARHKAEERAAAARRPPFTQSNRIRAVMPLRFLVPSFLFLFSFFVAQWFQCSEQRCNQALHLLPSNPRIL